MNITLQDIVTAALVLVAAIYMVRRFVRLARNKGAPSCGCGCDCTAANPPTPLVKLADAPTDARK